MKKKVIAATVGLLCGVALNAAAQQTCQDGYTETAVSGAVETTNVSDTLQVGTIKLVLTNIEDGEVVYDQKGGIMGRITNQDPTTGQAWLDHSMLFADGSFIETRDDEAQLFPGPTHCSFGAMESIQNFWGTKTFRRATGGIQAIGSLSVPPDCENKNSFELSGTICLAPQRDWQSLFNHQR